MHHCPPPPPNDPVSVTFTDIHECIKYIMHHVYSHYIIETHLNTLTLDSGEIVTDMPIFRYMVEHDLEHHYPTLNRLEFRDGDEFEFLTIEKLDGGVTARTQGLGYYTAINITVTLVDKCHRHRHDECGGEHEFERPIF